MAHEHSQHKEERDNQVRQVYSSENEPLVRAHHGACFVGAGVAAREPQGAKDGNQGGGSVSAVHQSRLRVCEAREGDESVRGSGERKRERERGNSPP